MNPTVFQAAYAMVTYDPEKRSMMLIWDGRPTFEEYKKPFEAMLEYGRIYSVDSMLSRHLQTRYYQPRQP